VALQAFAPHTLPVAQAVVQQVPVPATPQTSLEHWVFAVQAEPAGSCVDTQAPALHVWPVVQAMPQPPQLFASDWVLTSQPSAALPLQLAYPAAQEATLQAPETQDGVSWLLLQTVPHAPQLFTSFEVSTQAVPHTSRPPPAHEVVDCWHTPDPSHWKTVQDFPLQEVEPQVVPAGWPMHGLTAQTPDEQNPLWQLELDVQEVPFAVPHVPETHGSPLAQAVPQLPQLDGSRLVVSQYVPQSAPEPQVSVSPAAILYSTSRFASAPVFAAQVEPVRRIDCRVAPAAKLIAMGPESDQ